MLYALHQRREPVTYLREDQELIVRATLRVLPQLDPPPDILEELIQAEGDLLRVLRLLYQPAVHPVTDLLADAAGATAQQRGVLPHRLGHG